MDFLVVPTLRFRLLYVWFAIDHGRRRVLSFDVTAGPTAWWVSQQLREAFSHAPLHRFLIYDNDAIFCEAIAEVIETLGLHPQRTAFQSPWQNGTAERFVGHRSSGAPRSCVGAERGSPETAAPGIHRVLQRRARSLLDRRLAGRALARNETVKWSEGHPAPTCGRSSRPIHVAQSCLSARMNFENTQPLLLRDRPAHPRGPAHRTALGQNIQLATALTSTGAAS